MRRCSLAVVQLTCLAAAIHAQMLIHTSQGTPGEPPPRPMTVVAASTSDFLNSIGVASHLNYTWTPYNDYEGTKALLLASGIRNIRDGGADSLAIARFRDISAAGVRLTWILNSSDGVVPSLAYWSTPPHYTMTHFLEDAVGASIVDNVEVSNEIDVFYSNKHWRAGDSQTLSADPKSPYFWGDYILDLTRSASQILKTDPALSAIHLLGPSFGGTSAGVPDGSLYQLVDMGTFHPYMFRGNPSAPSGIAYDGVPSYFVQTTQPTVYIDEYPTYFKAFEDPYKLRGLQRPMVATETGYYTGSDQYSISEVAQAKYIPRVFAEYFRHSIAKTFVYEFLDEGSDREMEHSFGLVRADFTPKPAYIAIQSLIALLQDSSSSFKAGDLTYEFAPAATGKFTRTQYAHDLLLEKSNGDFFLLFWHEISDANRVDPSGKAVEGTDIDMKPPSLPVTITLPNSIVSAVLYTYDNKWKLHPEKLRIDSHRITVLAQDQLSILDLSRQSHTPAIHASKN